MDFIIGHPFLFGLLCALLGVVFRHGQIMQNISNERNEIISIRWYVQNRLWGLISSASLTFLGIIFIIVKLDPENIEGNELLTKNDMFLAYLASMSVATYVATAIMDKFNSQVHIKTKNVDIVESCKTMLNIKSNK